MLDDGVELVNSIFRRGGGGVVEVTRKGTTSSSSSSSPMSMSSVGDKESFLLLIDILASERRRRGGGDTVEDGVRYQVGLRDVLDLVSHEGDFKRDTHSYDSIRRGVAKISKLLGLSGEDLTSDDEIIGLLLRIKFNSFPVHNDVMQTVGFGIFPFASYINHSCVGNVVYSFLNGGRTIVFRASRIIRAGEQITYSYIDPIQPRAVRQNLLADGYRFNCACQERCKIPLPRSVDRLLESFRCNNTHHSKLCPNDPLPLLEEDEGTVVCKHCGVEYRLSALKKQEGEGRHGLDQVYHIMEGGHFEGALKELVGLHEKLQLGNLHHSHQLRHDTALTGVLLTTKLGDHPMKVTFLADLIQVHEDVIQLGTCQLAHLYLSLGQSLIEMNKMNPRGAIKSQIITALAASWKIYSICIGEDHYITQRVSRLLGVHK
jgi:hypothetical protein